LKFIDSFVNSFFLLLFDKNKKIQRILFLLVIIGFILRLIAAINLDAFADDMIYASQSAGILDSGYLSTHSNPPLYFYFTDIFYSILGYSPLVSRIAPLIFGTFLIILVFLLMKEFFDERLALASAFFVTFSNFLIRMTFSEQTLVLLFFCFSGIYFSLTYLKKKTFAPLIFAAISFGLGLLTKYNAPFFIFAFIIYIFLFFKKETYKEIPKKQIFTFIALLALFALPIILFNIFIYNQNQIVDVYVSRVIPVEKAQILFSGLAGQDQSFFDNLLNPAMYSNYSLVWHTDFLLCLMGLVGVLLAFIKKENKFLLLFICLLIIPFFLQSGGSALQKHFAFMHLLFALPAGYALSTFLKKISSFKYYKIFTFFFFLFLLILLSFNLGVREGTPENLFQKSATSQLKEFISETVKDKDLLIFDNRIYTSKIFWFAIPHHFTTIDQFNQIYGLNKNPSSSPLLTKVHFIECMIDDCGWGWIHENKEFNQSIENLFSNIRVEDPFPKIIKSREAVTHEFKSPGTEREVYRIYTLTLPIEQRVYSQIDKSNKFYFVSYLYLNEEDSPFHYSNSGFLKQIELFGLYFLYLSLLLPFYLLYLLLKETFFTENK